MHNKFLLIVIARIFPQDEAKSKYISMVNELCGNDAVTEKNAASAGQYEGITYVVNEHVTEITFARPNKKNAITIQVRKILIYF